MPRGIPNKPKTLPQQSPNVGTPDHIANMQQTLYGAGAVAGESKPTGKSGAVVPVPGTIDHLLMLEQAITSEVVFADTPATESEPPPPDSDYLKADNLRGCTFTVVSFEVVKKAFKEGDTPKDTVNYKIIVKGRPELGMRILSLQSGHAVKQARDNQRAGILAFGNVTVDLNDPDSEYAAYILKPAFAHPLRYYHEPWEDDSEQDRMPKSAALTRASLPGRMSSKTMKRLAKIISADGTDASQFVDSSVSDAAVKY